MDRLVNVAQVGDVVLLPGDLLRIGQTEGKLVPVEPQFHGISQRGDLAYKNIHALCDAHIHDPALDGTFAVQFFYSAGISYRHIL